MKICYLCPTKPHKIKASALVRDVSNICLAHWAQVCKYTGWFLSMVSQEFMSYYLFHHCFSTLVFFCRLAIFSSSQEQERVKRLNLSRENLLVKMFFFQNACNLLYIINCLLTFHLFGLIDKSLHLLRNKEIPHIDTPMWYMMCNYAGVFLYIKTCLWHYWDSSAGSINRMPFRERQIQLTQVCRFLCDKARILFWQSTRTVLTTPPHAVLIGSSVHPLALFPVFALAPHHCSEFEADGKGVEEE